MTRIDYAKVNRYWEKATPSILGPYMMDDFGFPASAGDFRFRAESRIVHRLTGDMKAGLFYARRDGADLVAHGTADRSMVAQFTAGVGYMGAFSPLVVAVAAGAAAAQSEDAIPNFSGGDFRSTDLAPPHDSSDHVHASEPNVSASASSPASRSIHLQTLATAVRLASSGGDTVNSLRDLVREGWITASDLSVPGHPEAHYLLVGGGALQNENGEPCLIAEPGGLPHGRLCVTLEGNIAAVAP